MQEQVARIVDLDKLKLIKYNLDSLLNPSGFECHPFKIGWYNDLVSSSFQLSYQKDTLAFVIISTPSMFEKAFIPFILESDCLRSQQDPLDQCMVLHFAEIKKQFSSNGLTIIHDFELTSHKRPKILVQTAGHASGAVRFYQRKDLKSDPWDSEKKIFGVCLHPRFGGWFALRGVAIFTEALCPNLPVQAPKEILDTEDKIVELLQLYNDHWQEWSFRDIIPVEERYSKKQMEYFSTKPADRTRIINDYRSSEKTE